MVSVCRLLFSCCLVVGFKGMAQQSVSKADKQPYSLSLTAKLHSTGHSIYSGIYLNHNANAEIGLSYKYKQIGAFINKNVDFADVHSSINFTTIGVFKSFQLSESIKLMPYMGYFFKQSHSFMDDNSDAWTCVVVRFKINRWLVLENTTLLGNLIRHHSKASLANRMNALILIGKFKLDAYVWYTHSLNNGPHFVSASLAITSPDWVITQSISARVQIAVLQQISNEKPDGCMYRGGLISLIVPIDLSMNNGDRHSPDISKNY
jgi:hypothetical protein